MCAQRVDDFLTRPCTANQISLGINTGICGQCPTFVRNVREAQRQANLDAQPFLANQKNPSNAGKFYCGANNVIKKWTLYYQCYHTRQPTFQNPFFYIGLKSPSDCFLSGKAVGALNLAQNNPNVNQNPLVPIPAAQPNRSRQRSRPQVESYEEKSTSSSSEDEDEKEEKSLSSRPVAKRGRGGRRRGRR